VSRAACGVQQLQQAQRQQRREAERQAVEDQRQHEVLLETIRSSGRGGEDRREAARAAATALRSYDQELARLEAAQQTTAYRLGQSRDATPEQQAYAQRIDEQMQRVAGRQRQVRDALDGLVGNLGGDNVSQDVPTAVDAQGNRIRFINGRWVDSQGNPVQ